MSELKTSLRNSVMRVLELRAQTSDINQIVDTLYAEIPPVVRAIYGDEPITTTIAVQPDVTPGWFAVIDGERPAALDDIDRVEVRGIITGETLTLCVDKVLWPSISEWRFAKIDNSERAHRDNGYALHVGGDSMPVSARGRRVDVTFDNGRMVYGVSADDVDWLYVKYFKLT